MKKLKSIIIFLFLYIVTFQSIVYAEFHHVDDCYVCHDFTRFEDPTANKYGIWDIIQTPNSGSKEVVFLDSLYTDDNYTDHANGDALYNGICEVCHTKNNHHNNDGYDFTDHFDGKKCTNCHLHDNEFAPPFAQAHRRHFEDVSGPGLILCTACHQDPYIDPTIFNDGLDLENTTVCNDCHSPGGTFPGVNGLTDPDIGSKANFREGIYESDGKTLKAGKDKWCVTCHDELPGLSATSITSIIVDNPEASVVGSWSTIGVGSYGSDSLGKIAGDGSSTVTWTPNITTSGNYSVYASWWAAWNRTNVSYTINHKDGSDVVIVNQYAASSGPSGWVLLGKYDFFSGTSGSVMLSDAAASGKYVSADAIKVGVEMPLQAPNIVGNNSTYGFYVTGHKIACTECHDASKTHIDHEHRTYDVNESSNLVINGWGDSYRLKTADTKSKEGLCLRCHNEIAVLGIDANDANQTNNFDRSIPSFGGSGDNRHRLHLFTNGFTSYFDSDFDSNGDSRPTCVACHNVHGSSTGPMMRDGRLASDYNTTNRMPALEFSYKVLSADTNATATWMPLLTAGSYEVYARWNGSDAAYDTPYIINHSTGSTIVRVDQRNSSPGWYHLGTFTFNGNASDSVEMTNDAYGSTVIADAVGWELSSGADGIPDIIVDNDTGIPDDPVAGTFSYSDSTSLTWSNLSGSAFYGYGDDKLYIDNRPVVVDTNATLAQSRGAKVVQGGIGLSNKICQTCHVTEDAPHYERKPFLGPKVINRYLDDRVGLNDGTGTVDITVSVPDKDHNSSDISVVIDLTPLGGPVAQPMSDNGDGTYTHTISIPFGQADVPLRFNITATDPASDVGTGVAYVYVAEPNTIYMDTELIVKSPADTWTRGGMASNIYGPDFEAGSAGAGGTATWNLDLNTSGKYEVYAWWASDGATSIATDALYTINHSGTSDTVIVDQRNNGNAWYSLGTYNFSNETPSSVVLSDNSSQTVYADAMKFVRVNSAPLVRLSAFQLDNRTSHIARLERVVLSAVGFDNDDDDTFRTLDYDWSANTEIFDEGFVTGYYGNKFDFNPSSLPLGFYEVQVKVTDSHGAFTIVKLPLMVGDNILNIASDLDGDGIFNESSQDFDGDGIMDIFDADNTPNRIPADVGVYVETEVGLKIRLGSTALDNNFRDCSIDIGDINTTGTSGGNGLFDGNSSVGGIFDFDIIGLNVVGQTVKVVIPLLSGNTIMSGGVYQKFNATTGWEPFVEDTYNAIHSAYSAGDCPAPGSNLYAPGLNLGDNCIQLSIKDGGLNDADGIENGEIKDPGGLFGDVISQIQEEESAIETSETEEVASEIEEEETSETEEETSETQSDVTYTKKSKGGSGSFSIFTLLILGLFGIRGVLARF